MKMPWRNQGCILSDSFIPIPINSNMLTIKEKTAGQTNAGEGHKTVAARQQASRSF
jgi:hypothetical protein